MTCLPACLPACPTQKFGSKFGLLEGELFGKTVFIEPTDGAKWAGNAPVVVDARHASSVGAQTMKMINQQ